jgi:aspartokinase/homoserine dehydrogenase 1
MKILKFGGSSLATAKCIRDVGKIILAEASREPVTVVVSAFFGITNSLLACARLAEADDALFELEWKKIAARHHSVCNELLGKVRSKTVHRQIDALLGELHDALHGTQLLRHCSPRALDLIASFGERLSAAIIAASLGRFRPATFVDAREMIVTDDQFTNARVTFGKTNRLIRRRFASLARGRAQGRRVIAVVTGFIGATVDGRTTTIGRDGSDYTAAILGAALGASVIEIWTDVDGVLSADPRAVQPAFVLPRITYEEAMELSYFGAKVLHSAAIAPAVAKRIPLRIKNTFRPQAPGTLISHAKGRSDHQAKGITSIAGLTLLTLRGLRMVGEPGIAERLFRALAASRVNVVLISQASSEHTICFAVRSTDAATAATAVRAEFRFELQHKLTSLDQRTEQTIIAIVGDEMQGHPGVSGKVFGALGRHNVNITAIAQGASERNISCVIDTAQQVRALNIIHQTFFEVRKRLALVVIGVGNIGHALLRQLRQQREYLLKQGFDLKVVGLANSRHFVLDVGGINLSRWSEKLSASRRRSDPLALASAIAKLELTDAAIVDCTASELVVQAYPDFVRANLHIITPNKRANVLPWRQYSSLMDLMRQRQKYFFDEANVGAGLPIMSTIRDLVASGDVIKKVEGIFSGTLSYLFNTFSGAEPFSALVRSAHANGLTEPDPRDDLSGQDVARKLLILARQSGSHMELGDVAVENLVPPGLVRNAFSPRFFAAFARQDSIMEARLRRAQSKGAVLRYVGTLEGGKARAGIKQFPRDHPMAAAKGSDNIIAFTTSRYASTPLVVQGPGAGADVTAMGVFSDILKLLNYLPH